MSKRIIIHPAAGGGFILVIAQVLAFFLAFRQKAFLEEMQITPPEVSAGLPLVYFFAAVVIIGLVLFLVPQAALKVVLKLLFLFLFAWGAFIALGLLLPLPAAAPLAVAAGLLWFLVPRVWLHNLMLTVTLSAVGTVFGVLLAPWTAVTLMAVISVYDVLAVRFGYMMWMVKRLAIVDVLPAFVIPSTISGWNLNLKNAGLMEETEEKEEEKQKEFSVLGGGDIGFPLLLIVSVFFAYGFSRSLVVAGFALLGLASAYLVQRLLLKGRPTPALPPITILCLAGFLIARFA